MYRCVFLVCVLVLSAHSPLLGQVIDFETLPGSAPTTDFQPISDQYSDPADGGVSFSLAPGVCNASCSGFPLIAKVGSPVSAFQGPMESFPGCGVSTANTDDMPTASDQGTTSCSFLTDNDVVESNPCALQVDYTVPVSAASGVLLDIDGNEEWTITAFESGNPVATVVIASGDPDTGDGIATDWAVSAPADQTIDRLVFDHTGFCDFFVGLAFDQFNTTGAPVPTAPRWGLVLMVVVFAAGGLLALRRYLA